MSSSGYHPGARRGLRSALILWLSLALPAMVQAGQADVADIEAVLDALHAQASAADYDAYFELYADGAVFLGTDAAERWPLVEFKRYTRERFAGGTGWTYVPLERHVEVADDGSVAWFDETLHNARLGLCRGSGVLVRGEQGWKIAQYNLTLLVPNEIAGEVADMAAPFDDRRR